MRTLALIILPFLFPCLLQAQELSGRDRYAAAETAYRDGRFKEAVGLLREGEDAYDEALRPNVCRLYALCHLAMDDTEQAEIYVRLLLKHMPYYALSLDDPVRFADLVEKNRVSRNTLVTASQQLETLEEAPVPVTLITEDMIRAIGADNLKEVLTAYVPGITAVEGNSELNIAMHGVYTSEQQKILVLLNGHRMNSRATNVQAPDYSISLDKVKQIEVLRGPASSLYGNAALTAVVNIITKEGKDVDGISVKAGIGSFGTYKADVLAGKSGSHSDFIGWVSVYASEGETVCYHAHATGVWRRIPIDGNIYLNGFNRKPAYDVGCILQWNGHWKLYLNHQHAKMQSVYSYVAVRAPYTYEKYRRINGEKPGHGRTSTRGELQYHHQWKDLSLDANLYADIDRQMNYEVDGDTLPDGYAVTLPEDEVFSFVEAKRGFFQLVQWDDYAYGASAKMSYTYGKEGRPHGTLLAGFQWENYTFASSDALLGDNFDRILLTMSEHNAQIRQGSEQSYSAFLQGKHYFTPYLIVNGGLRYDYRHRFNGKTVHSLSPRLAIIYKAGNWSLKACYARSFVDAPYFYRANTVTTYRGSENLSPEYMNALQLAFTLSVPDIHLACDCNVYYNGLSNLIYYDKTSAGAGDGSPVYTNAGSLDLFGVESSLSFTPPGWKARMNLTYQRVIRSENYIVTGNSVNGIPSVVCNLLLSKSILQGKRHALWLDAHLSCYSRQHLPVSGYVDGKPFQDDHYAIKGSCILNMGIHYEWNRRVETSLTCKNVLDTWYTRAGMYDIDVPQQGRSLLWKIGYKF